MRHNCSGDLRRPGCRRRDRSGRSAEAYRIGRHEAPGVARCRNPRNGPGPPRSRTADRPGRRVHPLWMRRAAAAVRPGPASAARGWGDLEPLALHGQRAQALDLRAGLLGADGGHQLGAHGVLAGGIDDTTGSLLAGETEGGDSASAASAALGHILRNNNNGSAGGLGSAFDRDPLRAGGAVFFVQWGASIGAERSRREKDVGSRPVAHRVRAYANRSRTGAGLPSVPVSFWSRP